MTFLLLAYLLVGTVLCVDFNQWLATASTPRRATPWEYSALILAWLPISLWVAIASFEQDL